jgi:ABC-type multidrug transport system fused ATPase/permease subunit
VVVAHRPETIAMADRVVEMAGGRIARDSGNGLFAAANG